MSTVDSATEKGGGLCQTVWRRGSRRAQILPLKSSAGTSQGGVQNPGEILSVF